MSVGKEWEIPLETNTKVLSRELFLGVVALKTPIQKTHYLRDMGPFSRYCHIWSIFANRSKRIKYLQDLLEFVRS